MAIEKKKPKIEKWLRDTFDMFSYSKIFHSSVRCFAIVPQLDH